MRFGKYEFGLVQPFGWYGFRKDSSCISGCVIYMFGPFFFSILKLDCVEQTGQKTEDCIISIEPFKIPIVELLNLKSERREKKSARKRKNRGKALPKKKKRIPRSKSKR